MRRLPVLGVALLTATVAAALIARAGLATSPTEFRSPDADAACRLEQAALVCSSLGSLGAVALRATSSPTVTHELVWWDASTPVLSSWRHGAISCRLDIKTIVCRTSKVTVLIGGDGFTTAP